MGISGPAASSEVIGQADERSWIRRVVGEQIGLGSSDGHGVAPTRNFHVKPSPARRRFHGWLNHTQAAALWSPSVWRVAEAHTCNAGALTFHRFLARRKCGEHGAHGEGVMLLAEPMTDRVIGLAIEVHRRATPGGWPSLLRGVASAEADRSYSVITVFSALPPC